MRRVSGSIPMGDTARHWFATEANEVRTGAVMQVANRSPDAYLQPPPVLAKLQESNSHR